MSARIGLTLKIMLAIVAACAIASAAFAQTGAEYPRTMPGGGGIPGGGGYGAPDMGGGSIGAPAPSGSGPSMTKEIPYDPSAGDEAAPRTTARSRSHSHTAHRHASPVDTNAVEPAQGRLKLVANSYAYERPTNASTRIQPVEAGKFVNVIGISRYYAQVKLKNSEIAYVPLTAIDLVKPTDKMFKLTADTPVLTAPNHSAAKIAEVHRGRDVHVVGVALNYMKIRMKDGLEGFIPVHALE